MQITARKTILATAFLVPCFAQRGMAQATEGQLYHDAVFGPSYSFGSYFLLLLVIGLSLLLLSSPWAKHASKKGSELALAPGNTRFADGMKKNNEADGKLGALFIKQYLERSAYLEMILKEKIKTEELARLMQSTGVRDCPPEVRQTKCSMPIALLTILIFMGLTVGLWVVSV